MSYLKPALTLDQQVALLTNRGMAGDPAFMKQSLATVSYYRLSAYWFHRRNADDSFLPGTTFDAAWARYVFDRDLRLHVMDAIEMFEIAVRTQVSYHHAHHFKNPFAYVEPRGLPNLNAKKLCVFQDKVRDEVARSHEDFVVHFNKKYGHVHSDLPIWMATEIMSLGNVLRLFDGSPRPVRTAVASHFGMPDVVLGSWIGALNIVRNLCAHHCRLWNRQIGVKPHMPHAHRYPDWHTPVAISNDRLFGLLTVANYCVSTIAPRSRWAEGLRLLLARHPSIPIKNMGFPDNWLESPLWANAR